MAVQHKQEDSQRSAVSTGSSDAFAKPESHRQRTAGVENTAVHFELEKRQGTCANGVAITEVWGGLFLDEIWVITVNRCYDK